MRQFYDFLDYGFQVAIKIFIIAKIANTEWNNVNYEQNNRKQKYSKIDLTHHKSVQ